jgi:hypothetical protein
MNSNLQGWGGDEGHGVAALLARERRREEITSMILAPLCIGGMCLWIAAVVIVWVAPLFVITFR